MKFYEANVIAGHLQIGSGDGREGFFFQSILHVRAQASTSPAWKFFAVGGWWLVLFLIFFQKKKILIFDCMCNKRQGDRQRSTDPATGDKKLANEIC